MKRKAIIYFSKFTEEQEDKGVIANNHGKQRTGWGFSIFLSS